MTANTAVRTALWMLGAVLFSGCGTGDKPAEEKASKQVVVYTSVDDVFARPICERFERETGIKVLLVPDTEETKSTGLLNRLIAEKERPQCDVFWSGDPIRAAILKAKGISTSYQSPEAAELPKLYSDPEGHWTGFSCRARVVIYNRDLVPQGQEPKSVLDLLDARFKDKACIANPLFGTTSMHAAALFVKLSDDKAAKFFDGFAANGGKILSSNGEVRRRVAAGEFAVGLTDTDDYNVARIEGKPVGVVYPDVDGMGTVIVPNCAVLIANGPNSENGKQFIDYLLTPAVEKALAASEAAQMPVRKGVEVPPHIVVLDQLKPMQVDYSALGARLEELTKGFLKEWVDRNSR
ncbi:MAG: extracellular solute-binding protein [Hyphomicrobiaceae bacterium]